MKMWSCIIALVFVCSLGLLLGPGVAESRITAISATPQGSGIALNDNGTVWLWGSVYYDVQFLNQYPGLGLQPVIMPGINHVVAVSGYGSPVVLKDDGTVWILGNYPYFENASLANSTQSDQFKEPKEVPGLDNIVAISGNNGNLLMLSKNGTVWAMGLNGWGQLGPSTPYGDVESYTFSPVQVTGLSNITAVSMGDNCALALKNDGTVWAWGDNQFGQRGDGTIIQLPNQSRCGNPVPSMVNGLTNVTAISAGYQFSMALKSDGTVWSWGRNTDGQLGDGIPGNVGDYSKAYSSTPVLVVGLTNVTSISASDWNTLALKDDGSVWMWGRYNNTQIDHEYPYYYTPTRVQNITGIVSVSNGLMTSMALDKYGVIWAWGDDEGGQLGDGKEGVDLFRGAAEKVPFSEALAGSANGPSTPIAPVQPLPTDTPSPGDKDIEYMAAVNGTIYAFTQHGLTAIDGKGIPEWNLSIPGLWTYSTGQIIPVWKNDSGIDMGQMFQPVPVYATDNGYIYLYTIKNPADGTYDAWQDMASLQAPEKNIVKELIAVSPGGNIAWTHDFTDDVAVDDRSHLEALDGRLYLYHDYNETVFSASGNVLFNLNNVADPAAVDESGNIYTVTTVRLTSDKYINEASGQYLDYRVPSNVVEKYSPDGTLIWSKALASNVSRAYYLPSVWNEEIGLPLYRDNILYVPQDMGVTALNKAGDVLWNKSLDGEYRVFNLMPFDSEGNLYLYSRTLNDANYTVVAISPNGTEITRYMAGPYIASASNGVIYLNGKPTDQSGTGISRDNLETVTVAAYDIVGGEYLWNFTTPVGQPNTLTINESNVGALFPDYSRDGMPSGSIINDHSTAEIIPAGNLTYIYFRTSASGEPIVYNQSTYTYYSALYALDRTGKLVWQKPMNDFMTAATANNSTIYYGTNGGGISVATIGVVAGIAVVGSLLVFFMMGSVTRARSKIDKNDNRNQIYKFIADRPGSTLYELAKEMGLNIGTLRYHLMILSLNHRIVMYNDKEKFVRYFINSNHYSKEEQMLISMMRRDTVGRIIRLIHLKPGITNAEISNVIGLADSGVSRYLNELCDKGIAVKTEVSPGRYAYSLTEQTSKTVEKLYWVVSVDIKTPETDNANI